MRGLPLAYPYGWVSVRAGALPAARLVISMTSVSAGVGARLLGSVDGRAVEPVACRRPTPHDCAMKSRVHPTYKTHYRVGNWRVYERALGRQRKDAPVARATMAPPRPIAGQEASVLASFP